MVLRVLELVSFIYSVISWAFSTPYLQLPTPGFLWTDSTLRVQTTVMQLLSPSWQSPTKLRRSIWTVSYSSTSVELSSWQSRPCCWSSYLFQTLNRHEWLTYLVSLGTIAVSEPSCQRPLLWRHSPPSRLGCTSTSPYQNRPRPIKDADAPKYSRQTGVRVCPYRSLVDRASTPPLLVTWLAGQYWSLWETAKDGLSTSSSTEASSSRP